MRLRQVPRGPLGFPCPDRPVILYAEPYRGTASIPNGALFPGRHIASAAGHCNPPRPAYGPACKSPKASSHDPRAEPASAMNDIASRKAAIPLKPVLPRKRPSRAEAEEAVRTLIAWAGDDPGREGLKDTPRRVTDAFEEYFSGYALDPTEVLSRQFEEAGGY